jgi:hypothetical protein
MRKTAPVFIGGAHRSGSTLLTDLLGVHEELSPVYDTEFVIQMAEALFASPELSGDQIVDRCMSIIDTFSQHLPLRPNESSSTERYHHGHHHLMFDRDHAFRATIDMLAEGGRIHPLVAFKNMIDTIFAAHCAVDRKERWINKTHAYVRCLPFLSACFPGMKFLHVVRDGRDIACSLKASEGDDYDLVWAANEWRESVLSGLDFMEANPASAHVVRYEELLLQPVETLNRALTWIGEETTGATILDSWCGGMGQLRESSMGRWLRELTDEERDIYWQINGDLLEAIGYGESAQAPSLHLPTLQAEIRT